jgi:hypothetical protein
MDKSLPVLITAFLREEKTLALFESLALMGTHRVYISMDKGRDSEEISRQNILLEKLQELGDRYQVFLKIRVNLRNQGLAVSVMTAADWFFQQEEFGVILEDDLVPSRKFLDFCLDNREIIESHGSCLFISGNSFESKSGILEPSFINYPLIWGWATTMQKWQLMRNEILMKRYLSWKAILKPGKLGYFATGLMRARRGRIDSWAVPLASRMYLANYTCLTPPSNLVSNNGDDDNSTHSNSNDWTLNQPVELFSNANYHVKKINRSLEQNRIIERDVYGIRWYHIFGPLNSLFFDRFRKFESLKPLMDRLRESI